MSKTEIFYIEQQTNYNALFPFRSNVISVPKITSQY